MPHLSEDKEHTGFLLKSEPGMGSVSPVSAGTLLAGSHQQNILTKAVEKCKYLAQLEFVPVEGFLFPGALW